MGKFLVLLAIAGTMLVANDCDNNLRLGEMQENAAAKAYNNGNLVKTQEHLRFALNNYMHAFKPCLNTPKEDVMTKSFQRVNEILKDEGFRNAAAFQKYLKAAK